MRLSPLFLTAAALACAVPQLWSQPAQPPVDLKWDHMDLGPFQAGTYKVQDQFTAKGLAIRVGQGEQRGTVLFDTELLRWTAAWTGGFIKFPRARGGLEGQIEPDGKTVFTNALVPGWAVAGQIGEDPRPQHQGHLAPEVAAWRGLYLQGSQVVLSYTVGGVAVLEVPGFEKGVFTRTLKVAAGEKPLTMLVGDVAEASLAGPDAKAGTLHQEGGHLFLELPARTAPITIEVVLAPATEAKPGPAPDPAALTHGGPPRWGAPLETKGVVGSGSEAYVVDEITLPEENRFGSWFRPSAHDFLPDGTAVVASLSGDVWLVSGLDDKLEHVRWRRFATGLFQPLGVKVVAGKIYVLGRDQITRLEDLTGDGEADFYECFNHDCIVVPNYHEFALDLQTDSQGRFLFAKGSPWQPTVTSPHQGCLMRVSADGQKMEIVATGLRAPNGMGVGPHDEITVSDNQGHWMPSNRLNIIHEGGFYGMVPAAHRVLPFHSTAGDFSGNPSSAEDQAAHKQVFWGSAQTPRPTVPYDLPLCWLPMPIDNSSGGEVWVPAGERWGPLGGAMLQMSYGKCALFEMLPETVEGVAQAGMVRFPMKFPSGIMRGRFRPQDGQLYLTGLRVWQTDGARDGCFSRVRYTGAPVALPVALRTTATGVEVTFAQPLDAQSAADADNYDLEEWNYLWSGAYGSPDFSVRDPEKHGRDQLNIEKVALSPDGKTVALTVADWRPAMQTRLRFRLHTASGQALEQEIYATVHRVPGQAAPKLP